MDSPRNRPPLPPPPSRNSMDIEIIEIDDDDDDESLPAITKGRTSLDAIVLDEGPSQEVPPPPPPAPSQVPAEVPAAATAKLYDSDDDSDDDELLNYNPFAPRKKAAMGSLPFHNGIKKREAVVTATQHKPTELVRASDDRKPAAVKTVASDTNVVPKCGNIVDLCDSDSSDSDSDCGYKPRRPPPHSTQSRPNPVPMPVARIVTDERGPDFPPTIDSDYDSSDDEIAFAYERCARKRWPPSKAAADAPFCTPQWHQHVYLPSSQ